MYTNGDDLTQFTLETRDRNVKLTFSVNLQFCLYPQKKEWTWDESKMMVMQDPIYR